MRSREDQKWYKWAGLTLGDGPRVKFFPGDVCKLKSDGDFLGSVKDSPKTVWIQLLSLVWNYVKNILFLLYVVSVQTEVFINFQLVSASESMEKPCIIWHDAPPPI